MEVLCRLSYKGTVPRDTASGLTLRPLRVPAHQPTLRLAALPAFSDRRPFVKTNKMWE